MSELIKELQSELAQARKLCALKDDRIGKLEWFEKEHRFKLERLSQLNNVYLGFDKLITLNSPILTPELRSLASTMHLKVDNIIHVSPAAWKRTNSHTGYIADVLGGFGAVEKVYQLPSRGGHQANVIFANPEARKAGFEAVKSRFRNKAPSMKFSLQQFPKLRFQDRCLQKIFKELKEENKIFSYSLNNYGVTKHHEFVFPLYTFRVSGNKVTRYEDSRCIGPYREGFIVPTDDVNFESPEFQQLKEMIWEHVQECQNEHSLSHKSRAPALPTLAHHIQPIIESVASNVISDFREYVGGRSIQVNSDSSFDTQDIQWPELGQNPCSISDSVSIRSRSSSPEAKVFATKSVASQSLSPQVIANVTSPMSNSITNAIRENNFVFSTVSLDLIGKPIAIGPISESRAGTPPKSSDFTTLQPIDPNSI